MTECDDKNITFAQPSLYKPSADEFTKSLHGTYHCNATNNPFIRTASDVASMLLSDWQLKRNWCLIHSARLSQQPSRGIAQPSAVSGFGQFRTALQSATDTPRYLVKTKGRSRLPNMHHAPMLLCCLTLSATLRRSRRRINSPCITRYLTHSDASEHRNLHNISF